MCDITGAKETPPDPWYTLLTETQKGHKQLVRIQKQLWLPIVIKLWSSFEVALPSCHQDNYSIT